MYKVLYYNGHIGLEKNSKTAANQNIITLHFMLLVSKIVCTHQLASTLL